MGIFHSFVSAIADGADATLVRPSDWNNGHTGNISNFMAINEVPSGTINGSNVTFTLAATPVAGTVKLWLNGLLLLVSTHYTISGVTITMLTGSIPESGDYLLADYLKTVA